MEPEPAPSTGGDRVILTPDQRLRVFVSSTLRELEDERSAVRRAITDMRLAPIMFELGARPHPPRNLYEAYLEQSHIFIGVYWESYGWVAPGLDISGLEDEYRMSGGKPRLIYVKEPAPEREPRLAALLEKVADEDHWSARRFSTVEELKSMVEDDLARLMTARFDAVERRHQAPRVAVGPERSSLPSQPTEFIGRDDEIGAVAEILMQDDVRLLTLTGPGGIGKTRLAFEVARRVESAFEDGIRLVTLAPVRDLGLVPSAIAQAVGVKESGQAALMDVVKDSLREKKMLLLLDNFEQLLPAGSVVADLLEGCAGLKILVTSRAVLHLRSEHEYEVPPLGLPSGDLLPSLDKLSQYDAVRLFIDRATASNPAFRISNDNAPAVAEICHKLDGLPLAIELAAARTRLLPPEQLLKRLGSRLDVLTGGPRDLPARQKTLRCAVDWSYDLLDATEKRMFARLGIFYGGWTLEQMEAICTDERDPDGIEVLASLLDKSLVRRDPAHSAEPRFTMLETIREYARERLDASGEHAELRSVHAEFFLALAESAGAPLRDARQREWMDKLSHDNQNLRAALRRSIEQGDVNRVSRIGWALWPYWWVRSLYSEGRQWMRLALRKEDELDPVHRARAVTIAGGMAFWQADYGEAVPLSLKGLELWEDLGDKSGIAQCLLPLGLLAPMLEDNQAAKDKLTRAMALFEETGDRWGYALGLLAYARMMLIIGEQDEVEPLYEEGLKVSRDLGADVNVAIALTNRARWRFARGELDAAEKGYREALGVCIELGNRSDAAYNVEGLGQVAAARGRWAEAARLLGAAERIREVLMYPLLGSDQDHLDAALTNLRENMEPDVLARAWEEGRSLSLDEIGELAKEPAAL